MPSAPVRATRYGRISKQTSTATSKPPSRPRGSPSELSASRSNRTKKRTKTTSTDSNRARAAALEGLIAQGEECKESTNTNHDYISRPSHSPQRTSRSSTASSTSSREHSSLLQDLGREYHKKRISSIYCRFPSIERTLIEKIYYGEFRAQYLPQLVRIPFSLQTSEIDSMTKLLRCVENYGQILCHSAPLASETALQRALSSFRGILLEYLEVYTLCSVWNWCFFTIASRIATGPDDPTGWMKAGVEFQYKLIRLQSFGDEGGIEE